MKSTEDSKFQKVVPNTAKVIYAWDKNILSISKNSYFCKQEIYKNDHIIDIYVNTDLLTNNVVSKSIFFAILSSSTSLGLMVSIVNLKWIDDCFKSNLIAYSERENVNTIYTILSTRPTSWVVFNKFFT